MQSPEICNAIAVTKKFLLSPPEHDHEGADCSMAPATVGETARLALAAGYQPAGRGVERLRLPSMRSVVEFHPATLSVRPTSIKRQLDDSLVRTDPDRGLPVLGEAHNGLVRADLV